MLGSFAPSIERNHKIDVIRGGFSLYILIAHCLDLKTNPGQFEDLVRDFSVLAVPCFFAISAYLLLTTLHRRQQTSNSPYLGFYLSRCFRIFPLWWLLCLWLFISGEPVRVVLANAFWIMGFTSNPEYWPIEVAWSLFIEEVFYLLFLVLMPMFRWPLVVFSIVFMGGLRAYVIANWSALDIPALNDDPNLSVPANLVYFFIGAFVYHLSESKSPGMRSFCDTRVVWRFTSLDLSLFAAFLFVILKTPFPIALTVLLICLIPQANVGVFTGASRSKTLGWVGVRCYGVYVLHDLVKERLLETLVSYQRIGTIAFSDTQIEFVVLVGTLTLTLFLAAVSYRFVEEPAIRLGRKLEIRLFGKQS